MDKMMVDVNSDGRPKMSLVIEGLKPNTKYIVRVRAVNSCGNSPWSKGHQGTFKTLEA